MDTQTIELVLLGVALSALAIALPRRHSRPLIPTAGIFISSLGISILALHAMRSSIALRLPEITFLQESPGWDIWRFVELVGLITVGSGVVLLSYVAEDQRRERRNAKFLQNIAPELEISPDLLQAVLKTSPGATLVLRKARGGAQARFQIVYATAGNRSLRPESPVELDGEWFRARFSQTVISAVARIAESALDTHRVATGVCTCRQSDRSFEMTAGAHGATVIVLLEETTERRRAEESLRQVAFNDPVTGLANRYFMEQTLADAIREARASEACAFAVLYLDFDGFKQVNDQHGHHVGDALLKSIGDRIRSAISRAERTPAGEHFAARLGGDEFAVCFRDARRDRARAFAESLRESLAKPHQLDELKVVSTASIGMALSRGQHENAQELLKQADAAMYTAKQQGKNQVVVSGDDEGEEPGLRARRRSDWTPPPHNAQGERESAEDVA
ncbi:MAG: GGDEF domain-containing protein [Phycisphaerales bacterium]